MTLSLITDNAHEVRVGGRRILFHVPTTSLLELDELSGELLDLFRERSTVEAEDVRSRFDGRFPAGDVVTALRELLDLNVVSDGGRAPERAPVAVTDVPLSTIVLNVTTGCNLSCGYCYKEDLATPARGERMTFETAVQAIELLLVQAASRPRVNVVFFGGEPLSNLPLVRRVVEHAEERVTAAGKQVDFSLTTNATLLTDATIEWLDAHRFGLTVSMDGPKALHDRHRRTVGGEGTYDVVARNARRLLERYRSRPIGARVTLAGGVTDVVAIHRHLRDEIGFFEVGFSPVTSGTSAGFALTPEELGDVFRGMKRLGEDYLEAALRDENIGFSNLHQVLTDLAEGRRKSLPCGAGVGMLAVDGAGSLHLCHRFTGSTMPTFGDVREGVDRDRLGKFLEAAQDRSGRPCETCRIRNLCAGGCYHESYARFGDPLAPVAHYCDILRDWIDFGIGVYARIAEANPGFFARHLEPRRAA
ncbi:MAG: uncharacterized protein QOD06_2774 [Candidatus Binatota bacterium]|nr:uncharacterized protein [Candidatus Binatota bacterium]